PSPVMDGCHGLLESPIDAPLADLVRNPGEPGSEHECFRVPQSTSENIDKLKKNARVNLHRSADIAQHHQRSSLELAGSPAKVPRKLALTQAVSQHPSQIEAFSSLRCLQSPCPLEVNSPVHFFDQFLDFLSFRVGEVGEVFLCQPFSRVIGWERDDLRFLLRFAGGFGKLLLDRLRNQRFDPFQTSLQELSELERFCLCWFFPEEIKGSVEQLELLIAAQQCRSGRVPKILPAPDID